MPSKQVTDREKSARAVAAAAETHAAEIAARVSLELEPHLKPGEILPDPALLLRLIGRKILADNAALVARDHEHEKELADDAGPREARDDAASKVRGALVDLRGAIDSTYGAAGLTLLGLEDAIPVDPTVIAATASSVVKALKDTDIKLPRPKRAAMKLDRSAFAEDVAEDLPALQKALTKVAKEDREKEVTQRAKNEAMARNDSTFTSGASFVAASCLVAGLVDIAAKVRPSGRKPGQTAITEETGDPIK